MRDLFNAPLTPGQRQQAAQVKAIQDAEHARQRAIGRDQRDRVFKLEKLMDAIGAKLARSPDDRELGRLFHLACDRWHEAESALYHDPQDGPLRLEPTPAIPQWIADALVEIGRNFNQPEPLPESDPVSVGFAELSAWLEIQKETARSQQAA